VPDGVSPLASHDEAALDAVHFAWAGPTEPGAPHYDRLQGPRLLVEWENRLFTVEGVGRVGGRVGVEVSRGWRF
ncbi:MAG: DUF3500 domain-containing protein, partial [Actinomycetota bacterium]|nr:DUF3500 domain-containing protein [Actinomycetota bacterium]